MNNREVKVYYCNKLFMTYNLSCIDDTINTDELYEKLSELVGVLTDAAWDREHKKNIDNIWTGFEYLRNLRDDKIDYYSTNNDILTANDLAWDDLRNSLSEKKYIKCHELHEKECDYENEHFEPEDYNKYIIFECNGRKSHYPIV